MDLNVKPLSLRRNFSWTMTGNIAYSFCQWAMLVSLAKLGSSNYLGQFSLGLSITAPLIMFFNLALRPALATDVNNEYPFQNYLVLRLFTISVFFITLIGLLYCSNYPKDVCTAIVMVGLTKMIESISDIFWGFMQKHERFDLIARSMIIKGILSVSFLSVGLHIFNGLIWGILGIILSHLILLIAIDIPCYARFSLPIGATHPKPTLLSFDLKKIYHLTCLTIPLGFVQMLGSLITNFPRFIIEQYWGLNATGIYTAIASLNSIGAQLVNALGQSTVPRLAKYYADGKLRDYKNILIRLILIGACLGIGGTAFALAAGRKFLELVYSEEYGQYNNVFIVFAIISGVNYITSFLGYSATSTRTFRMQFFIQLFVFLISALLCYTLVPRNGLMGAASAVLIANIIHMFLYLRITITAFRKKQRPKNG